MSAARHAEVTVARVEEAPEDAAWRHAVRLHALGRMPHPESSWPRDRVAWFATVALHAALLLVLQQATQRAPGSGTDTFIAVRLIDPSPAVPLRAASVPTAPAPVAPVAAPHQPSARRARSERRLPESLPDSPAAEPGPAPPRVFGIDGSAALPDDLAEQLDRKTARDGFPQTVAPSTLLDVKRPLKVRPNHFAQYWAGSDGKPLHETLWRYVTATREFTAPWGGRWTCAWVLIVVACADVPDKPWNPPQTWKPATELDER
jgi:hypothetical protein